MDTNINFGNSYPNLSKIRENWQNLTTNINTGKS